MQNNHNITQFRLNANIVNRVAHAAIAGSGIFLSLTTIESGAPLIQRVGSLALAALGAGLMISDSRRATPQAKRKTLRLTNE
jgi:hypothetical protein